MIHVFGSEGTREYSAALALREMIVAAWPAAMTNTAHDIRLIAGAKCHGQRTRDVDVLLLASLAPGVKYAPFLPFSITGGAEQIPHTVAVRSLCAVIEVKDSRPEDVEFSGTTVYVRYGDRWHSASEQNEHQLYAVKNYVEGMVIHGQRLRVPRITPLLWLRNVPLTSLPPRPHNILGTPLTWDSILNIIAQLNPPKFEKGKWVLTATGQSHGDLASMVDLFTKVVVPTRLDRQRMERITNKAVYLAPVKDLVGQKMLVLRGRGGAGKTMRLLQLASHLCDDEGARVLILTYNKALVADIRRLLTILGISSDLTGSTIYIQTVHSFLYTALRGLGITTHATEHSFLEQYEELKDEALSFLEAEVVSQEDVERLVSGDVETFRWDYVFVDEGQDWPKNERDLLLHIYSPARLVVADGIDQLVRSAHAADWRGGLSKARSQIVPLRTCLRMKSGLARFVSATARHLGLLNIEWEENSELPGGRVIIVEGPYLHDRGLHDRLLADNKHDGNSPVDMLFCIPPALVTQARGDGEARSVVAAVFEQWGYSTWDGASTQQRENYPTEVNQLRIVQYESCRGLEGWTVVNLELDRLYDLKVAAGQALDASLPTVGSGPLGGDHSPAHLYAARWLFIPLTRAMDTLVIQLSQRHSPLRTALQAAAAECGDYVTWIAAQH